MASMYETRRKQAMERQDEAERVEMQKRKASQSIRAAHEARTGMVENMRVLGWKCSKWTESGRPNRFWKRVNGQLLFICSTLNDLWRAERDDGKVIPTHGGMGQKPVRTKLITPHMTGPVTLAMWIALETGDGRHCIAES